MPTSRNWQKVSNWPINTSYSLVLAILPDIRKSGAIAVMTSFSFGFSGWEFGTFFSSNQAFLEVFDTQPHPTHFYDI